MYFEGAAEDERETTNTTCFRDAVGLARSRDLITWDTAHPYRVALAPSPSDVFRNLRGLLARVSQRVARLDEFQLGRRRDGRQRLDVHALFL